jgi:hypothetical protein
MSMNYQQHQAAQEIVGDAVRECQALGIRISGDQDTVQMLTVMSSACRENQSGRAFDIARDSEHRAKLHRALDKMIGLQKQSARGPLRAANRNRAVESFYRKAHNQKTERSDAETFRGRAQQTADRVGAYGPLERSGIGSQHRVHLEKSRQLAARARDEQPDWFPGQTQCGARNSELEELEYLASWSRGDLGR